MENKEKGEVLFGADIIEDNKTGENVYIPYIEITFIDTESIKFVSDSGCSTEKDVEEFCKRIFRILNGPKNNLKFFETSGAV